MTAAPRILARGPWRPDQVEASWREEPGDVQVFVDGTGKEIPIAKSKIKKRSESTQSLMPDNFGTAIGQKDFDDLIEYLLSHRSELKRAQPPKPRKPKTSN